MAALPTPEAPAWMSRLSPFFSPASSTSSRNAVIQTCDNPNLNPHLLKQASQDPATWRTNAQLLHFFQTWCELAGSAFTIRRKGQIPWNFAVQEGIKVGTLSLTLLGIIIHSIRYAASISVSWSQLTNALTMMRCLSMDTHSHAHAKPLPPFPPSLPLSGRPAKGTEAILLYR